MKVTVIVCTHNHCQILAKALESLAASTLPSSVEWEVLVVDNNSNDRTREVVEEYCRRFPGHFCYLFVSQPGKSHALNAGIRGARGDVLAFTDDDVTVEPKWLQNLTAPLYSAEWVGVGGRTLPEKGFTPPRWIPRKSLYALAPLALFDRGPEAIPLAEAPFGNNMAYRKAVFEKYGSFRIDLGPCPGGGTPQKSEDSEFGVRLLAACERLRYEPSAVLYHATPQNRLQKQYFLDWWFDKARADIRGFGIEPGTKWFVDGIPLTLFRRLAVWTARWMVTVGPSARFDCKIKVWSLAGQIVECHRLSLEAKPKRECNART